MRLRFSFCNRLGRFGLSECQMILGARLECEMKKITILGYLFTATVLAFSFFAVYSFGILRDRQEEIRQEQESLSRTEQETSIQEDSFLSDHSQHESVESENVGNEHMGDVPFDIRETESVKVDAGGDIRTNPSMLFVVGQYDWITGIVMETVEKFPEELLGFTRKELLSYLLEHPEYGTLLSFSEHAVYLRKADEEDWAEYTYYLVLEEEGLMVYHLDQTTLYLDTGIMAQELKEEDRELLTEGFYIKDTAGLFDYLQTVTS